MGLRVKPAWLVASFSLAALIVALAVTRGAQGAPTIVCGNLKERKTKESVRTEARKLQLLTRRGAPMRDRHHRFRYCVRSKAGPPDSPPPDDPPPGGGVDPNGGPGGTWNLRFRDEFSGSSLDLDVWRPNWLGSNDTQITYNMVPPGGLSTADPANISVANGAVTLKVKQQSSTTTGGPNGGTFPYAGAAMTSNPTRGGNFSFTGGYVEFRAKLATKDVVWPALWLFNLGPGEDWSGGEIDVMESGMTQANVPRGSIDPKLGASIWSVATKTIANQATTWHTYACDWEPGGRVRWYYDGELAGTYTSSGVPNVPMALMIDLAVFTIGARPTGSDSMQVDYVRVWQR
jgi:beta-glucanase (GH16 family)